MLSNVPEESEKLVREVSDLAEAFITNLKRGKLAAARSGEESLSTAAAVEMADVMSTIVRLFQNAEKDPHSTTIQLLKAGYPAAEVASMQVSRLLILVARTGDAMLRAQFATLFLMNVTRRVLSIVRESAANSKATDAELEDEAKTILNDLASDDEAAVVETPADTSSSSSNRYGMDDSADPANPSLSAKGMKPALKRDTLVSQPLPRRGLSVRFAGTSNSSEEASGGHMRQLQQHSTSVASDFGGPLLQHTGSIVATEIPGRQLLKRAPSRCEQVLEAGGGEIEFPVRMEIFYQDALDAIDEFKRELEGMTEELCRRSTRQLHSSDTIITLGCSHTIRRYLLEAAQAGHHFKVFILEGAPLPAQATQEFAEALCSRGITAQLLPDSSAYVVMSMCTKVLVGAENVLANGGMLASIGTHVLCAAARHFAVPVLVATTTLKMSPYYPSDQLCTRLVRIARSGAQEMPWSTYGSPEDVWPSPFGVSVSDSGRRLTIHAPVTEYVPPELITLFLTNDSELLPSQIHRIVRANYSDAD
ncbi:putative putative eIF-2B GDP-GTP exchange factor [Leishmania infantum JPCM5]|uniref:Translation initiation factor eIF2B subunit beta n=3 Tax=Leishmania donovani species complex TaxID=38574 RepID=A0A6L0WUB2_LEIIN|nr:putative putative eIF-2B GDP-GTP exchange factor [Leishmania infantum JPCM5]XP_003858937.1 translation initiation factor eif-2b beta subunit, putative [Leishmania donovani]CAC9458473.1 Translation_initiation_factor_eIF-2B_subunit_beta_-_putative [Leishmania infantum]AYU76726.1 Translation initiation factor eIF-2B subunit beta, putative [Leishmania donovani]TPP46572.1 Initiation factor 2 subunit family protein [Leishmania donovani]CAM66117.1 putative putative eIF-2B GDP-GTP exchange factor [|eukprot:XP_001463749.1 putative putative eIF-2B GDP-GTP exchange factor [Leishmania infantum JPCM5]